MQKMSRGEIILVFFGSTLLSFWLMNWLIKQTGMIWMLALWALIGILSGVFLRENPLVKQMAGNQNISGRMMVGIGVFVASVFMDVLLTVIYLFQKFF